MPLELIRIDRLVFVRLQETPTAAMADALCAALVDARREVGRPLIYLALIPANAKSPSAEMRPVMAALARHVNSLCEAVHLVVEAEGFQGTILRSAITAVAMVTRERNLTVHRRLADALADVQKTLGHPRGVTLEDLLKMYGSAA